MLCTDGRLQRLVEIDAMFRVEFDALRIHVHKSFVWRCLCRARFQQILFRFVFQDVDGERLHVFGGRWIAHEINENAAAGGDFAMDGDVDDGGAAILEPCGVEWPLVSFQENVGGHGRHVVEIVMEEEAFVGDAVCIRREIVWNNLLVCSREIPTEFCGGEAELELCKIISGGSCFEGEAVGANLTMRPDGYFVKLARSASCENDIRRVEDGEAIVRLPEIFFIQAEQANDTLFAVRRLVCQQRYGGMSVKDGGAVTLNFFQEAFEHVMGGFRAGGCGALARIMVGLVSDVCAEGVVRERDADAAEIKEGRSGAEGFHIGCIAMHHAALEERFGEIHGAVWLVSENAELVVSLLVRAGIVGSAVAKAIYDDGNVFHAELLQTQGAFEPGGSRAYDDGVQRNQRAFERLSARKWYGNSGSVHDVLDKCW